MKMPFIHTLAMTCFLAGCPAVTPPPPPPPPPQVLVDLPEPVIVEPKNDRRVRAAQDFIDLARRALDRAQDRLDWLSGKKP